MLLFLLRCWSDGRRGFRKGQRGQQQERKPSVEALLGRLDLGQGQGLIHQSGGPGEHPDRLDHLGPLPLDQCQDGDAEQEHHQPWTAREGRPGPGHPGMAVGPPGQGQQQCSTQGNDNLQGQCGLQCAQTKLLGTSTAQGHLQDQQGPEVRRQSPEQKGTAQGADRPGEEAFETGEGARVCSCKEQEQQQDLQRQGREPE